jgi:TRAP-type C4-dicarboxylate transport system permease small subunit
MLRGLLDRLYAAGFVLAALSLVAIALLVLVQVLGRVIDKSLISLGQEPVGIAITSLSELGGFLFVGAAFLALAGTLRAGGHVRVDALDPFGPGVLCAPPLCGGACSGARSLWLCAL